MSNVTPFVFGLGGGLALWQLARPSPARPASAPRHAVAAASVIQVDVTGITIDGARVDAAEAVERAKAVGQALVVVSQDAPASTCAALLAALRAANVVTQVRTVNVRARNAAPDTKDFFTLITYPRGIKQQPTVRYFRAESRIPWAEARDRLAAAGLLDPALAGRTGEARGWMLSIDPKDFRIHRAEPLPGPRNSYISTTFTLVVFPEGEGGPEQVRWFRAGRPTLWDTARDRLADAGIIDVDIERPQDPGYWILTSSPRTFDEKRAEPLPLPRDARRAQRFTLEGRTILRDGEAILRVDRVDLGNARYALSPYHADRMAQRVVRLLNRYGAR